MVGTMVVEIVPWCEGWPAINAGGAEDGVLLSNASKLAFASDRAAEALCPGDGVKVEERLPEPSKATKTRTAARTRCRRMA